VLTPSFVNTNAGQCAFPSPPPQPLSFPWPFPQHGPFFCPGLAGGVFCKHPSPGSARFFFPGLVFEPWLCFSCLPSSGRECRSRQQKATCAYVMSFFFHYFFFRVSGRSTPHVRNFTFCLHPSPHWEPPSVHTHFFLPHDQCLSETFGNKPKHALFFLVQPTLMDFLRAPPPTGLNLPWVFCALRANASVAQFFGRCFLHD